MKAKLLLFWIASFLFSTNICHASDVRWGVLGGANFPRYSWDGASGSTSVYGINGSAGLTVSFLQNRLLGLRIVGLMNYINASGDPGRVSGLTPTATATLTYFFDKPDSRLSVGLGYGYESFAALKRPSSFPKVDSATGPLADAKLSKKSGEPGLFAYAQGFLPLNRAFNLNLFVFFGLGYDF